MAIPKAQLTMALAEEIFQNIIDPSRIDRSTAEAWRNTHWRTNRLKLLASWETMQSIDIFWDPPRDGPIDLGMMLSYYVDPMNREKLRVDELGILSVWVYDVQLEGENAARFEVPLRKFRKIVDLVQPEFALVDDYSRNVKKRTGEDLRRFAWGATIYGPEMARAVGREKISGVPAPRVDTLDWGGVWIQAAQNPFLADFRAKRAIEKHLSLKDIHLPAVAPRKLG